MARKNGLNRKEQLQAAKWMEEGVSPKDIAKKFHTTADVVKRFTRQKMDEKEKELRERAERMNSVRQKKAEKVETLTAALELTGKDAANAEEFK